MVKSFSEYNQKSFSTVGEYFEGSAHNVPILALLNLKDDELKPFTRDLFISELSRDTEFQSLLTELSQGINALFQFQDILAISLDTDLVNQNYPYYESLVYLRESVVSWLDRNVLAALTLLRPFLELSILHLYWNLRCEDSNKPYYDWLRNDAGKPGFSSTLTYVFEKTPMKSFVPRQRLAELNNTIQNIYKSLCAYNHAPKINESIAAKSGGLGNLSLESFLYCLHITTLTLRQVIYLYILIYPMSLFPVERHTKWGFGGPVGLFFDKMNFARLEAYVGAGNIVALTRNMNAAPKVVSLSEWFDGLPKLTSDEIDADWRRLEEQNPSLQKSNATTLPHRLAIAKSYSRSIGWALNYVIDKKNDINIPDDVLDQQRKGLNDW